MKRLGLLMIILMVLVLLPVSAGAWEWSIEGDTLTVSGSGAVEGFDSASAAPWYGRTVRKVVVTEGITELGSYAFRNCATLTEVHLPDSLHTLGVSAFEGCTALEHVYIGTGLQNVGEYAFQDCTALSGVYITDVAAWCGVNFPAYSSSPMYYAQELCVNGTALRGALRIPEGVTTLSKYAFYGCEGITELHLPETVKTVGSDAFAYCGGLTYADLGGVTEIGSAAFSRCTALKSVSMDRVIALGDYSFAYCAALETAVFPASLKTVGQRAFYDCTALKTAVLPEGLEALGGYAFYGCAALETVTVPESLTVIPDYAFYGCKALSDLTLPDTLTAIEKHAFYGCTGLTSLTIPKKLTDLGSHAFYNCTGLETLSFEAVAMKDLKAGNNVFYKAGQPGMTVTVAAAVTRIPAYLFFPYSTHAPNVTSIVFEQGSACGEIGKYAFANCKALKEVVFAGTVPTIGDKAFQKVTARCLYPANWASSVCQQYGGTLSWLALVVESRDGRTFTSFEEALSSSNELKLLGDAQVDATLQEDMYLDLNGYDLRGTLNGGFKVYGTDSSTDSYDGANAGHYLCTGVVPEVHCKVDGKRYMTVGAEGDYTFHRFYMGITHMTLRPTQCGVGFKGVFYGDDAVRGQIAAMGCTLTLEGNTSKTRWKDGAFESGAPVSLLVRNFDPEQHGETPLSARLCLRLQDGTVIESAGVTMTLRGLMEQLSDLQLGNAQVAALIAQHPIMTQWNIENLK